MTEGAGGGERWHLHWAGAMQFLAWLRKHVRRVRAAVLRKGRYWIVRYTFI